MKMTVFLVIELKKGRGNQQVVGQILSYVGWVKKNIAEPGQKVRGIIVAADGNPALIDAVSTVSDFISIKFYRVKFNFESPL
jgi:restriction system protein